MKRIAILSSTQNAIADAIVYHLKDFDTTCFTEIPQNIDSFDLVVGINFEGDFEGLNLHFSLLPAFDGSEPVKQAILCGVKVTGITVYYTKPFKIVTQYPLIITNESHYDDIKAHLEYLAQTIYPLVIEKILKNESFEVQNLLNNKHCSGACTTCGNCNTVHREFGEQG